MKKFLAFTALLSFSSLIINADSLKINNKFKDQVYITIVTTDNEMTHTLIESNHSKFMEYEGEIDSIIINYQQPDIALKTISRDELPANIKFLTILTSHKIALA